MSTNQTTDLARQEAQVIIDPATGEIIDRADVEKVADLYQRIQDVQAQWSEAKKWCARALIDAADQRSEWGKRSIGGVKLTIPPPSTSEIEWDIDELHKLEALVPPEVYGELLVQEVVENPQTGKLKTLARQAGPDSPVGLIITRAEQRKPKTRYVTVNQ